MSTFSTTNRTVQTFRGNGFALKHYSDWVDATIYILAGPILDNIQHNITIQVDSTPNAPDLQTYVHIQTVDLETMLKSCTVLKREFIRLFNGMAAFRLVYSWIPADEVQLVQDQVYVLHNGKGYKLTASMNKYSRQSIGAEIEKMMLSFVPMEAGT
ncbi:MAG: DcrB-related protein [Bacteroidetes Order II. Incertae sedis bacterium]|nr:DcrB-related protein [Bacteroidetes Order II. bacterium]